MPTAPVAPVTAPTSPVPAPSPPSPPTSLSGGGRLVAYVPNWLACPDLSQTANYTHIIIAFAVSYTYNGGPVCDTNCNIGSPVPVCNNAPNPNLVAAWKAAGKKVLVSFGGASMGGSWSGGGPGCWDYCVGKESSVVTQLTNIVKAQNFDGVDIDYEWFYDTPARQNFLQTITTGLRASLPAGSLITHAPMDADVVQGTAYYNILKAVSSSISFFERSVLQRCSKCSY